MYSRSTLALKFLRYYFTSSNGKGYGTHSPFIFHFITKVLNDKRHYAEYDKVENLRRHLSHDRTVLTVEDFGAGSVSSKINKRTIASIARNASKSKKFGQLLFRMVKQYQPVTILELGTSLGLTTSYLSLAKPDGLIFTMEGAGEIAAVAEENFKKLELHNISIRQGNFDNTLSSVIGELGGIDFAFIDGNHRREPTERYFQQLLPNINNDSILVFDDIHWSPEMEIAWNNIKAHPSVSCSIDLFFIGIILFRKEFLEKQDFTIRY